MKNKHDDNNLHSNSRRQFLKTTAIALTGFGVMGMTNPFSKTKTGNQLRVIVYNVYEATGWPPAGWIHFLRIMKLTVTHSGRTNPTRELIMCLPKDRSPIKYLKAGLCLRGPFEPIRMTPHPLP